MLEDRIHGINEGFSGTMGVYAKHLSTGEEFTFNAEELFETASTIKVLIMIEVFRQRYEEQRVDFADLLTMTEGHQVSGSGVMKVLRPGARFSIGDTCALMMAVSDNTATNMLIDLVGGVEPVNATARALGLPHTELHRKIGDLTTLHLGTSSPRDYGRLLEMMYRGEVISDEACREMIGLMKNQQLSLLVTRYLPYDLLAAGPGDEEPSVTVAAKYGWLDGSRNDAGIVFTRWGDYVISLWTKDCADHRYTYDQEAMVKIPHVSRALFDHFTGYTDDVQEVHS